ncbi:hypothetical protein BD414DRAFT_490740 [Trametes punicea]|nr:hypothetical protein BD414DRAFT_490740 [Trametes punicea]
MKRRPSFTIVLAISATFHSFGITLVSPASYVQALLWSLSYQFCLGSHVNHAFHGGRDQRIRGISLNLLTHLYYSTESQVRSAHQRRWEL